MNVDLSIMSKEVLVRWANAISSEFEQLAMQDSLSLEKRDYDLAHAELKRIFDELCSAIEHQGIVVSDHVVISEYM